jgi:hypothetical protein
VRASGRLPERIGVLVGSTERAVRHLVGMGRRIALDEPLVEVGVTVSRMRPDPQVRGGQVIDELDVEVKALAVRDRPEVVVLVDAGHDLALEVSKLGRVDTGRGRHVDAEGDVDRAVPETACVVAVVPEVRTIDDVAAGLRDLPGFDLLHGVEGAQLGHRLLVGGPLGNAGDVLYVLESGWGLEVWRPR